MVTGSHERLSGHSCTCTGFVSRSDLVEATRSAGDSLSKTCSVAGAGVATDVIGGAGVMGSAAWWYIPGYRCVLPGRRKGSFHLRLTGSGIVTRCHLVPVPGTVVA